MTLVQAKYKRDLEGKANFPENGVAKMIRAVGTLSDPQARLANPIGEVRAVRAPPQDGTSNDDSMESTSPEEAAYG